jgi:membrane protease YdiL (CAAX protease family)
MMVRAAELLPGAPRSPAQRVLRSREVRFLLICFLLTAAWLIPKWLSSPVALLVILLGGYALLVKFSELRPVRELSLSGAIWEGGLGLILGIALMSASVGVIWLCGGYHVVEVREAASLFNGTLALFAGALVEEVIFRLLIFRLTEAWLGTWPALAISSVLFGLAHLLNPHPTLQGAVSIAIEAGTLLGVCFALTRRIWLIWALHAAWNWAQGNVFGIVISGSLVPNGILRPRIEGSKWLSGGEFGIEGSVQATLFCFLCALVILREVTRRGQVLAPSWRRANSS